MASNADKKSNATQIAQAVLDEVNQAIKVNVVAGGGGGGGGGGDVNLTQVAGTAVTTGTGNASAGTQRVVLASDQPTIPVDIQDTSIAVSLNKDEDSVTIYAPNNNTTPIPVTGSFSATVTSEAALDILKTTVVGQRNNQVEISFHSAPGSSLITNTTTGTGAVTYTNGHALYSTGTGVTSSSKAVSVRTAKYRPAHEIYAFFTAAFTTPTSANSYQRIGLYDASNGFFIGYNGLTFGITKRVNGVDTFTPASNFNTDLLNGGSSSLFKRNGTSEAINYTYSNLFRIRFAWLGSANILFEVFSPDAQWVTFHNIRQPNTDVNPSVYNPDLPMTVEAVKSTADATNLIVYSACWAAGTTSDLDTITATLSETSLASLTRSVITGQTTAGGGGFVNVKVNPSGALNVAATQDGTWNINNISGTVSLPTGAATLAAQNTGNASLSSIDGKIPALGQTTMSGSQPVVIASNQSAVPMSPVNTLVPMAYDFIAYTSNTLTDVYQYRSGGSGGTLVRTVTITYTDSTKNTISTIAAT